MCLGAPGPGTPCCGSSGMRGLKFIAHVFTVSEVVNTSTLRDATVDGRKTCKFKFETLWEFWLCIHKSVH